MLTLGMVLMAAGAAGAQEPVADDGSLKVRTGPIGDGPWKFDGGGAQAWDPDNQRENGWYEYYCLNGEKFISAGLFGTHTWNVAAVEGAGCQNDSSTVRIYVTPQTTAGIRPKEQGAELGKASAANAFHAAGAYKLTATLGTTSVVTWALIAGSGSSRTELICAPSGFTAPTHGGTTWTIHREGSASKFPGCDTNQTSWLYGLNLNPP